jgi:hypothetical protein
MFRGGRPLKRWRYVGVFCEELMACAAFVRVGPARQSFWAVYTREDGRLRERTRMLVRRGAVELPPGRVRIHDRDVRLDLELDEDGGIQAQCVHGDEGVRDTGSPNGGSPDTESPDTGRHDGGIYTGGGTLGAREVWTRKQAGVRAHGTLTLDGGSAQRIEARAVIDDTAGYHPRDTEWRWSAGVGRGEDGVALAWNLVAGVNDPPTGSERAVWVDGEPNETAPVRFAADLGEIVAEDADGGSRLSFAAEAVRRRHENLLIVRSDYTAPFGAFSGTLPGGIRLASGLGVMEHHRAKW